MAKLLAANERGKEKDYYGITYVLLKQRAGGRVEGRAQLASAQFADDVEQLGHTGASKPLGGEHSDRA